MYELLLVVCASVFMDACEFDVLDYNMSFDDCKGVVDLWSQAVMTKADEQNLYGYLDCRKGEPA